MKHDVNIPDEFIFPKNRFNEDYIEERLKSAPKEYASALRSALKFMYLDVKDGGIVAFDNKAKKIVLKSDLLEKREIIMFKYLFTRVAGSERQHYGKPALIAARDSRFRCLDCGFGDVRALCLDHVWVEDKLQGFRMLCHNCHAIKTRNEDSSGKKLRRDKKVALRALLEQGQLADPQSIVSMGSAISASSDMPEKIGKYVRRKVGELVLAGKLHKDQISLLKDLDYSKRTFNLRLPFLSEKRDLNRSRYYKIPIMVENKEYYLTNDWFRKNSAPFEEWLTSLGGAK